MLWCGSRVLRQALWCCSFLFQLPAPPLRPAFLGSPEFYSKILQFELNSARSISEVERPEVGDDTRGFAPPFLPGAAEDTQLGAVRGPG